MGRFGFFGSSKPDYSLCVSTLGPYLLTWIACTARSLEQAPQAEGVGVQSRMAPDMFQACLNAMDTSKPHPWASKDTHEGRATERCGLTPAPSAYMALSLEQAPLGNPDNPCQQAGIELERQSDQSGFDFQKD